MDGESYSELSIGRLFPAILPSITSRSPQRERPLYTTIWVNVEQTTLPFLVDFVYI